MRRTGMLEVATQQHGLKPSTGRPGTNPLQIQTRLLVQAPARGVVQHRGKETERQKRPVSSYHKHHSVQGGARGGGGWQSYMACCYIMSMHETHGPFGEVFA